MFSYMIVNVSTMFLKNFTQTYNSRLYTRSTQLQSSFKQYQVRRGNRNFKLKGGPLKPFLLFMPSLTTHYLISTMPLSKEHNIMICLLDAPL